MTPNIRLEIIVCFTISTFIFSLLLSFSIDLYSLMLLTPMVKIAGINSIFCKLSVIVENKIPFNVPSVNVNAEIVYPNDNPLKKIIANTTGIPITVVPANAGAPAAAN